MFEEKEHTGKIWQDSPQQPEDMWAPAHAAGEGKKMDASGSSYYQGKESIAPAPWKKQ